MAPILLISTVAFTLLQVVLGRHMPLHKRIACNHDNCFRDLLGNSPKASPFCSSYLAGHVPTTTVTFTTPCTERPNAVSTACSCLLADTPTTTPSPTATQCAASNNYGNIYIEDAYDTESAVLGFLFPYSYENNPPGFCCNLCYQTPGCYGFTEGLAESGSTYTYCELAVIPSNSPIGPNVSPTCPTGKYSWPQAILDPWVPGSTGGSGQGPCGIFP